jgi:hypothetical protein
MAFTTLPTLYAGMVLTGDHLTTLETAITEIRPVCAVKTADQTNTTTTIADDTELQIALAASTSYEGYANLIINAPAAGDFKLQFSVPSGTTGFWSAITPSVAVSTTPYTGALAIATQAQQEGSASDIFCRATFQLTTTSAGTFKVQHALNTASGTLTVKAASILVARTLT